MFFKGARHQLGLRTLTAHKTLGDIIVKNIAWAPDSLITARYHVMAASSAKVSAPLTFDLPDSLIEKIGRLRTARKLKTSSDVVRQALEAFDIAGFKPTIAPHRQISVRITGAQRKLLKGAARQKKTSVGEIIRAALEAAPLKRKR